MVGMVVGMVTNVLVRMGGMVEGTVNVPDRRMWAQQAFSTLQGDI
jgi:hypothetical protein